MKKACYLIRLDDICSTMNFDPLFRCQQLFRAYGIKPLIAVIPDNKDQSFFFQAPRNDFMVLIKNYERSGWTIGMHGYQHLALSTDGGILRYPKKSEFAGLSLDNQIVKIRKAWNIFTSYTIQPTVWVAPWHSFDYNTLLALKQATPISIISDGIAFDQFFENDFFWIPQQFWHPHQMPFGLWTLCLHPNLMKEHDFKKLELFLEKNSKKILSFQEISLSRHKRNMTDKLLHAYYVRRYS